MTEKQFYGPAQTSFQLCAPTWEHTLPSETPGAGREGSSPEPGRQSRTLAPLCSLPSSYCGFLSEKKHKQGGKRLRMRASLQPLLPTGSDTGLELLNCCVLLFSPSAGQKLRQPKEGVKED